MKYIGTLLSLVSLLVAGFTLTSCGDDEPENPVAVVEMLPDVSQDIVVDAWSSQVVGVIRFNATADWSADVLPANSSFEIVEDSRTFSKVEWLEVNPFQGGAGIINAELFLKPNHTYDSRYAVVRVNSATNSIEFHVTQKGITRPSDGGDSPVQPI